MYAPAAPQGVAKIRQCSARTAEFNKVFLTGNIRAIRNDAAWDGGFYSYDRPPVQGIKAMADIAAEDIAIRKRTADLRAVRLAKEAADRDKPVEAKTKSKKKKTT